MRSLLATLFFRLISLLPLRLNYALGGFIGWWMAVIPNNLRHITRINIALCYPDMPSSEQAALVRASLKSTARTAIEAGPMWLWSSERALKTLVEVEGESILNAAVERGKGIILALPHLGCWEMVGLYGADRMPMTSLYRPLRLDGLDQLVRSGRERNGATLVPTDASGIRSLYQALKRGELIAILPDQEPADGGSGTFAPFFDIETNTTTLLSRLAAKSEATVLFSFAERLPKGGGYRLHFLDAPRGIAERDQRLAATAINQGVETCIARAPTQYQWAYKRFRSRPKGEPKLYKKN